MLRFIFALALASLNFAQASEYKKMQCTWSEDEDWNHIAEYSEGSFYDEIKLNYYNVGVTSEHNCTKFGWVGRYGATEFEGVDYPKAHKVRCSTEDGIFYSQSRRKSEQGHALITEIKINFITEEHSYGRWVCQPGVDKDCPNKEWRSFACRFVE